MIDLILRAFEYTGRTWKIGGVARRPTQNDVEKVLDDAAKKMYTRKTGDTFDMGGLHIQKQSGYYDVYVHVGTYK